MRRLHAVTLHPKPLEYDLEQYSEEDQPCVMQAPSYEPVKRLLGNVKDESTPRLMKWSLELLENLRTRAH